MRPRCCRLVCTPVWSAGRREWRPWSASWTTYRGNGTSGSAVASRSRGTGSTLTPTRLLLRHPTMVDTCRTELLKRYTNVADCRLGAVALFATDEFFAAKERMLQPTEPEWRPGVYDAHGKWMDGWESRRRRDQDHDYCIVRLGAPSILAVLEI